MIFNQRTILSKYGQQIPGPFKTLKTIERTYLFFPFLYFLVLPKLKFLYFCKLKKIKEFQFGQRIVKRNSLVLGTIQRKGLQVSWGKKKIK